MVVVVIVVEVGNNGGDSNGSCGGDSGRGTSTGGVHKGLGGRVTLKGRVV